MRAFALALIAGGALRVTAADSTPRGWEDNWPQWRGPHADGTAPRANPPLQWSETNNVRWKVAIPGAGTATPAVWRDRVFVLTAVALEKMTGPAGADASEKKEVAPAETPVGSPPRRSGGFRAAPPTQPHQFVVLCLDRQTGTTRWQKIARLVVPHEGRQENNTFASASPITDGELVFAFFGSRGLYCYDFDGNLKWEKDFGRMRTKNSFGEGASPALHGDTLVVNWDHEGDDFIVALDKQTGKERWRQARDEGTGWSTPLIVEHGGRAQVIVNATGKVRSYDLAMGEQRWECGGQTDNAIPSPVTAGGVVYLTSGFRGSALKAIKLGATGDVTATDAVAWSHNKNTPYVPSPLLVDGLLYLVTGNNGVLSCFDAKTGAAHFEGERLDSQGVFGIYASPVSAKDRVYVLSREGTCLVLKKGPKLEVLAKNKLAEKTDASLALVGHELYLRGHQSLYCIGAR